MVRPGTRASSNCSRLCPGERWMSSAVRTVPGGLLGSEVWEKVCCDVRREQAASRNSVKNARVTVAIDSPLRESAKPIYRWDSMPASHISPVETHS